MKRNQKGVYCLEIGEWDGSMKFRNSVEPILAALEQSHLKVPYIHRDIATETELRYYIRKWTQGRHKAYPILYLAFHGSPGHLHLAKENGRATAVSAEDLFALLRGKCQRRIIHFGACSVLSIHGNVINRYLRESEAAAISGYADNVDWITSSIFDLLFLSELQNNKFTSVGLRKTARRLKKAASQMSRSLSFKIQIKK